jgi:hypothetical protein
MRPETDPTSTSPKTTRCRIAENRIRPIRTRYGPGVVSERPGSSPWSARRRPRTDSYKIVSGTAGPGMGPVSCSKEPDQAHDQCGQQRIRFARARGRPGTELYSILSGMSRQGTGPVSCPKEPDQANDQCDQKRIRPGRGRRRPGTRCGPKARFSVTFRCPRTAVSFGRCVGF